MLAKRFREPTRELNDDTQELAILPERADLFSILDHTFSCFGLKVIVFDLDARNAILVGINLRHPDQVSFLLELSDIYYIPHYFVFVNRFMALKTPKQTNHNLISF